MCSARAWAQLCVRASGALRACKCVCARERGREGGRERERGGEGEREGERDWLSDQTHGWHIEREGERVGVLMKENERGWLE